MAGTGDYKNNPLYTDITKLDFVTPAPSFSYNWNKESSRWEPAGGIVVDNLEIDFSETNSILSGISGSLSSSNDEETHRLLSGISGSLSSSNDQETHRLLSGVSGELSDLSISIDSYKILTKTVNQKIEEDFILLENIPDEERFGSISGETYGIDRFIINDIFNIYFDNGRTNPSSPETGHTNYFIHSESIKPNRSIDSAHVFHTDTNYSLRFDNSSASSINSYELKDFTNLYESGLVESVLLINESNYPIQFHTINQDESDMHDINLLTLYGGSSVRIESDEAEKIYIKRPHTISGFTIKYTISYKEKINT